MDEGVLKKRCVLSITVIRFLYEMDTSYFWPPLRRRPTFSNFQIRTDLLFYCNPQTGQDNTKMDLKVLFFNKQMFMLKVLGIKFTYNDKLEDTLLRYFAYFNIITPQISLALTLKLLIQSENLETFSRQVPIICSAIFFSIRIFCFYRMKSKILLFLNNLNELTAEGNYFLIVWNKQHNKFFLNFRWTHWWKKNKKTTKKLQ